MSIGNILSHEGQAKLADLEYVKKTSDLTSHEMRTASESIILSGKSLIASQQGTMHFMSIEVAAQTFLFVPPDLPNLDFFLSATEQVVGTAGTEGQRVRTTQTKVPLFPNHLHDLESLWWVAVWMVFYNNFSSGDHASTLQDTTKQLSIAQTLFPPTLRSTTRAYGFQNTASFQEACGRLPSNKRHLCHGLDVLRGFLIVDYSAIEAGYPESVDPKSSKDDIYDKFTQIFARLKTVSQGLELKFIPHIRTDLLKEENLKRPRYESTNNGGAQKVQKK